MRVERIGIGGRRESRIATSRGKEEGERNGNIL